jgi:mannose-6-phosphate isomerase
MDKSKFITKPFLDKVEKPWGYEYVFCSTSSPVVGKILHIDEGKRFSLQYHDQKQEVLVLVSGRATISLENSKAEMEKIEMEINKGYFISIFQKHRVTAITDCDIFEASTGEKGNTVRLKDDYNRPTETEGLREKR